MSSAAWRPFLTAVISWIFFNVLLGYGYILSALTQSLGIRSAVGIIITVAALSVLTTLVGFFIGATCLAAFAKGATPSRGFPAIVITSPMIFAALQLVAFIPIFLAPATTLSEIYTLTEFACCIIAAFAVSPLLVRIWIGRLRIRNGTINALALLIAAPLTFVTLSLASESYSLNPTWFSYALYYSAYGIYPLVILSVIISRIWRSEFWAVLGLIVSALPLSVFYLIGQIG